VNISHSKASAITLCSCGVPVAAFGKIQVLQPPLVFSEPTGTPGTKGSLPA
jgi:hypothetical protein